jgi:hypothetical protein
MSLRLHLACFQYEERLQIDVLAGRKCEEIIRRATGSIARKAKIEKTGGPGQIRTADLRFRKPSLYPSELQGRKLILSSIEIERSFGFAQDFGSGLRRPLYASI